MEKYYKQEITDKISTAYTEILSDLGENAQREGLLKTPERVAKALQFLTHGYDINPADILKSALFHEEYSEMVLVKDIEVYSMCEHHMLPFFGKAHVAYIPNGKIVGLSKFARLVDVVTKRLQVQERITSELANMIDNTLKPHGVMVVVEAEHLCMCARGVRKYGSQTITSAVRGQFKRDQSLRAEFLSLIGRTAGKKI